MWSREGEGRMFQVEDPEAGKHRMCLTNNKQASRPQENEQENGQGQGGNGSEDGGRSLWAQ